MPKILVLVIASDEQPVYVELQKIWKSYMHLFPKHVEAYFIKADPDLPTAYEIKEDVIWSKTQESFIPGISNKTFSSMECMLPRIDEFDYVLRTNLSSFYVFPRLLKFLKTLPENKCYCAVPLVSRHGIPFGWGCGFILSRDLVKKLVDHKTELWDRLDYFDDVLIGLFFQQHKIKITPASLMNFPTLEDWQKNKDKIPSDTYHFRVKNPEAKLRLKDDVYIHSRLLKMFYHRSY